MSSTKIKFTLHLESKFPRFQQIKLANLVVQNNKLKIVFNYLNQI